jgi:SAM-dependent methyltransferase
MTKFKDNFSKQATVYYRFRPTYPKELFEYLSGLTEKHKLAWDCGTGNGQSADMLAEFYEKVYATDPSSEQINNAVPNEKITYKVEKAESPELSNASVDLITVAQAVHWFDLDRFYRAAKRVLKPNGIIAIWAYGIPQISDELDPIIKDFHDNTLGAFWQPENKLIEQEYRTLPFPFTAIDAPAFYIQKYLDLNELLGHFRSWSATQKYIEKFDKDPLRTLRQIFSEYWEDEEIEKEVVWKLILRIGKLTEINEK